MSTSLLNSVAVSRRSGDDASTILSAYIQTAPAMAQNHTADNAPAASTKPKGTGAGDHLIEPR
jgi:hypothetical protein